MTETNKDWPHEFLTSLLNNYTAWDVPVSTFFLTNWGLTVDNSNQAEKVVKFLTELESKKLITWRCEPDERPTKQTYTFNDYQFHARLTFEGYVYISTKNRQDKQDQSLLDTNSSVRNINGWLKATGIISLVIAAVSCVYIALDYTNAKNEPDLSPTNKQLERTSQILDSMLQVQRGIDSSLETMAKDSTKNALNEP
jgi:hypothetical protein